MTNGGRLLAALLLAAPALAQTELWSVQPGTPEKDRGTALAPDGAGGVFVAGATLGDLGGAPLGHFDVWLQRYDGTGLLLWQRKLGSSKLDRVRAAASDGSGGVFLCGSTQGDLAGPSAGEQDAWLARYDAAGSLQWTRQFGTASHDDARALTADGAGGVVLAGSTLGSLAGPSSGVHDAWLARFDVAGALVWSRQVGTPFNDFAMGVASDGAGGSFVAGYTQGDLAGTVQGGADAWVARFDVQGDELWRQQSQLRAPDWATAVAPDGAGGLFLAGGFYTPVAGVPDGEGWVEHLDGSGARTWSRRLLHSHVNLVRSAIHDGAGGVYLYCSVFSPTFYPLVFSADSLLLRLDGSGASLWGRRFGAGLDADYEGGAVALDGAGGTYVCGSTWEDLAGPNVGESDAWLMRLH